VDRRYKIELLTRLIDIHDLKLGNYFSATTKRMVDDLVDHPRSAGLHGGPFCNGDMTQAQRDRVMNKFRKSGLEFLRRHGHIRRAGALTWTTSRSCSTTNPPLRRRGLRASHRAHPGAPGPRGARAISLSRPAANCFRSATIGALHHTPTPGFNVRAFPTEAEVGEARENVFLGKLRGRWLQSGEYQKQDHLIERLLEEGFKLHRPWCPR